MRIHGPGLLIVLVAASLSGCLGGGSDVDTDDRVKGPGVVGLGSSSIVGTVTDDSLLPVPEARVTLDQSTSLATDQSGAFRFLEVAPGEHEIIVEKEGFEAALVTARVGQDETAEVSIQLNFVPGTGPYVETFAQQGLLGCGVAFRTNVIGSPSVAACAPFYQAGLFQFDQYALEWPLPPLHKSSGFIGETRWERNQVSAAAMRLEWNHWAELNPVHLETVEGNSPIWVRVPIENLTAAIQEAGNPASCTLESCYVNSLHWTSAGTLGPSAPIDATVMFQQRYEDFLSVFFNQPLPVEFTAIPDA